MQQINMTLLEIQDTNPRILLSLNLPKEQSPVYLGCDGCTERPTDERNSHEIIANKVTENHAENVVVEVISGHHVD